MYCDPPPQARNPMSMYALEGNEKEPFSQGFAMFAQHVCHAILRGRGNPRSRTVWYIIHHTREQRPPPPSRPTFSYNCVHHSFFIPSVHRTERGALRQKRLLFRTNVRMYTCMGGMGVAQYRNRQTEGAFSASLVPLSTRGGGMGDRERRRRRPLHYPSSVALHSMPFLFLSTHLSYT